MGFCPRDTLCRIIGNACHAGCFGNRAHEHRRVAALRRPAKPLPSYHFLPFFSAIERRNFPVLSAKFKIPKNGRCFPLCFRELNFTIKFGKKRSTYGRSPLFGLSTTIANNVSLDAEYNILHRYDSRFIANRILVPAPMLLISEPG